MALWLIAVILAATPQPSIDAVPSEAVEVFRCDFGAACDKNFDAWPDGWTRRRGTGYPLFVPVAIVNSTTDSAAPESALKIQLDGGAAAIYSPPIPVNSLFSYRVDGRVKTEGLRHDIVCYSLTFSDEKNRVLETHESIPLSQAKEWTEQSLGPLCMAHAETKTVVVGLHLRPEAGQTPDLRGAAWFDDVRLLRLPRVLVKCDQKQHVYTSPRDIEVSCDVSGVLAPNPPVVFTLEDMYGNVLARHETHVETKVAQIINTPVVSHGHAEKHGDGKHADKKHDDHHDAHAAKETTELRGYAGKATWQPPLKDYGFYRVRVTLADAQATRIERATTLVIARPLSPQSHGEFGWSLPRGDKEHTLQELAGLVSNVGIHWLKFPMWYGEDETQRPDQLASFADRVGTNHINIIGVLDRPPASLKKVLVTSGEPHVATLFNDAPVWQAAVDPVMTRLSLKVRWWQLGSDRDTSFVGYPDLHGKITEIKRHFLKYGQEVQVGLAWPWLSEASAGPWDFLTRTAEPALSPDELVAYLGKPTSKEASRWTIIEPLARQQYDINTRAADLVRQMIAAKQQRATGIFLPDPFDPRYAILSADGTPDELLLPWRNAAQLLGGAEYLGSVQLPSGSKNHIFQRDQDAVMVIWNSQPTRETLYLGEEIQHFDLWGKQLAHTSKTDKGATEQTLEIGALPTFVTGLSLPVAKWRISAAFEQSHLPSIFSRDQQAKYKFTNPFGQGIGGEVRVVAPADWEVSPLSDTFRASVNEQVGKNLLVRFKSEAASGPQLVKVDYRLTADRDYAFSVYCPLSVGLGEVAIEATTELNAAGELVVEQTFINQTDDFVSFKCLLFAPNRRRESVQVLNLGRGRHTTVYRLSNGAELLGQTLLLRAEELDGERVLNYRIMPER